MAANLSAHTSKSKTVARVLPSSLLINLMSLAIPLIILQIYDRILPNQSYGTAFLLLFGATIAILLDALMRYVRSWMLGAAAINTEYNTYQTIIDRLNSATPSQLKKLKPGALQESLKGVALIKDFYSGGFISGLIDVPFAIIFLMLITYVGGSLVVIPIVVWAITFILVWLFTKKSGEHALFGANAEQERMNFLILVFGFLDNVKSQASETKLFRYFKVLNQKRYLAHSESERNVAVAQELIQIAAMGTSVAMVLIGSISVLDGTLTSGGLAACSILAGRAVAPLSALLGLRLRYSSYMVANHALTELLDGLSEADTSQPEHTEFESLTIKEASFQRFDHQFSFDLTINKGEAVHITHTDTDVSSHAVTIAAGLEVAEQYESMWGEEPINMQASWWREHIGFVATHPNVISGSLLDNLCAFNNSQIEEANLLSNALGLNNIVSELSEGVETKVGFNLGTRLSRGTIKLVSIVGQLSQSTPLVVLDRPERDLDIDSVNRLKSVLEYYMSKGRSFILNTEHPILLELITHTSSVTLKETSEQ
ncbi:ABC transporter transmembrane domain-containing protein [Vibrio gallicus]|uniref:ABC transporter transmembrane domain-containing protein n=1 Tax=Vibrio gallicus TaxID=190897 RepID=UPI0021C26EBE|nr:ABC transporter transmembrane domain-containing protein [Vibrio gallicus]